MIFLLLNSSETSYRVYDYQVPVPAYCTCYGIVVLVQFESDLFQEFEIQSHEREHFSRTVPLVVPASLAVPKGTRTSSRIVPIIQYCTINYHTGDPNKIYWIGSSVIGMTTTKTKTTIADARPNSTWSYYVTYCARRKARPNFLVLPTASLCLYFV
jgi:hypothetical protein